MWELLATKTLGGQARLSATPADRAVVGTGHSELRDFGSVTALRIGSRSFYAPDSTCV
jgi:hypothetical protein